MCDIIQCLKNLKWWLQVIIWTVTFVFDCCFATKELPPLVASQHKGCGFNVIVIPGSYKLSYKLTRTQDPRFVLLIHFRAIYTNCNVHSLAHVYVCVRVHENFRKQRTSWRKIDERNSFVPFIIDGIVMVIRVVLLAAMAYLRSSLTYWG